ncbi:MAG TPA: hypothetical protein VE078_19875 [Thermoanaerobaculia bacterium]|nr:hypothetical protein [Thermoanaerobaculia bacterium]
MPRRLMVAAAVLGAVVLWSYLAHPGPDGTLETLRLASLAIQVTVLVLSILSVKRAPWALASIVVAELLFFHLPANPPVTARLFYPETPPIRYVRQRLGPWMRVAGLGPALRANFASAYGLADPRSSNPAKPAAYVEAVSRINLTPGRATDGFGEPRDPLYQFLGVRYLMTSPDSPLPGPWKLALRHPSAWVWERPRALPRIFLPHSILPCAQNASWSDCTRSIRNFRREAVIREGQAWSAASPRASELDLGSLHPAWLSAQARLVERRLLASSVYQDGGWIVLKNGNRQPATLANGPFVAAWLPEGDARIDLVYRPRGFFGGMLLAALALTAAAVLWMPMRR